MKQRGRKGMLSVVSGADITATERPSTPPELTKEQKMVWVDVVNGLPADWFSGNSTATLLQYCRHVVAANHVAELLEQMEAHDDIDVVAYDKLLKMQERESRIILSAATKMRFTPQATYDREKVKNVSQVQKPWES